MIKIESLSKSYGNNEVLKNLNLSFNKGEVVGIVGENGAGKSTLFKCISGLENYTGKVEYGGGNLKDTCGFLPTNPFFLSKITGKEYLQLMCKARDVNIPSFEQKNIFDLPLNQYADTYSTGMKKKLALMGLLLLENEVFILDEPFNGVDIHSNIIIKQVIQKLKEIGKVVILSSHIFSTLSETCDILYHLKKGTTQAVVDKKDFHMIEEEMLGEGIEDKLNCFGL